jgi:hypothetical protein
VGGLGAAAKGYELEYFARVPCSVIQERWVSRPGLARCNVGKATLFSGATKAGGAGPGAVSMLRREGINVEGAEGDGRREMRQMREMREMRVVRVVGGRV